MHSEKIPDIFYTSFADLIPGQSQRPKTTKVNIPSDPDDYLSGGIPICRSGDDSAVINYKPKENS